MKRTFNLRFGVVSLLVIAVAFSRMIPHIPNFSPLGAVCLFGSAYFARKWQAYLIPLLAVWLGDLFLNNVVYGAYFNGFAWFYPGWYWQYGSYILMIFAGSYLFRKVNMLRVAGGTLGASVLFFAVSNFGVWLSCGLYPHTSTGLTTCFTLALPFFRSTLWGNILYSGVMFGTFTLAQQKYPALRTAKSYHIQ